MYARVYVRLCILHISAINLNIAKLLTNQCRCVVTIVVIVVVVGSLCFVVVFRPVISDPWRRVRVS